MGSEAELLYWDSMEGEEEGSTSEGEKVVMEGESSFRTGERLPGEEEDNSKLEPMELRPPSLLGQAMTEVERDIRWERLALGGCCWVFSSSLWMKWQRGPYEQKPMV